MRRGASPRLGVANRLVPRTASARTPEYSTPAAPARKRTGTFAKTRCLTQHTTKAFVTFIPASGALCRRGVRPDRPRRPPMSDPSRPSHELFHDVTDARPRTGRATGGTLAVSIVAHALILAAVIVVPLLATDTLPDLVDPVSAF